MQSKDYPRLFPKIEVMQQKVDSQTGICQFSDDGRAFSWRLFRGSPEHDQLPEARPLVVFCHGFKGFMHWGGFPQVMQQFARSGFHVLQFNFSLNGTLPSQPETFADLPAFRQNTLSREVKELIQIVQYARQGGISDFRFTGVVLCGHSRGGFIVGAAASHIKDVRGIITWAGVVQMRERLLRYDHLKWQKEGFVAELNVRTGQMMELGYTLWQDFEKDENGFFRKENFMPARIPLFMVHGSADTAVDLAESQLLYRNRDPKNTFLCEIPGGDHTFGMRHPCAVGALPADTQHAVKACLEFLRRC